MKLSSCSLRIRYGAYDWRIVNNKPRAEGLGGTLDLPATAVGMATASKILYQTSQGLHHMNIHHISSGTVLAGPSPVEIVREARHGNGGCGCVA